MSDDRILAFKILFLSPGSILGFIAGLGLPLLFGWKRSLLLWLIAALLCAVLLPSAASLPARPRPAMSVSFVVEPAAVELASPSPAPTDVAGFATTQ